MLGNVSRRPLGWLAVLLMALTLAAAPKAAQADSSVATYLGGDIGYAVYARSLNPHVAGAGLLLVDIDGVQYRSFCLDLYKDLSPGQNLIVDGVITPGTSTDVDWSAVEYIMFSYGNTNDPVEAAAAACAIWHYTTAKYGDYPGAGPDGRYRFLTDPGPLDGQTSNYDGWSSHVGSAIRARALEMIASVPLNSAGICTFLVPNDLLLMADDNMIFFMPGEHPSTTVGANVVDMDGNPVQGVTVSFTTDLGTLSAPSAVTDANGNAFVTVTNSDSEPGVSMVCASVPSYNSLYLNGGPDVQDLGVLPDVGKNELCVQIEWMLKEKCCDSCGKIGDLTFRYTGEGARKSCFKQNPWYVSCKDYDTLPLPDCVRIVVTDDNSYSWSARKYFDGVVCKGDEFTVSASTCGVSALPSTLRIIIYDQNGCKVLQCNTFRCSSSDPLWTGDKFGGVQLIDCESIPADDPGNCYNRKVRRCRKEIVNCFKSIYNNWPKQVKRYCGR